MDARRAAGFTLIEVMAATVILLIGALGLVGMANQANAMNGDGRRMMRATAIAQDLLGNIEMWAYDDPRLANRTVANDGNLGDRDGDYETLAAPDADHGEADLSPGAPWPPWLGLPGADLAPGGFERFWNVAEVDDFNANAVADMKRISVIVRWPQGSRWRRIILYATKVNPAERL